jgi:hypothetical protein
MTGGMYCPLEAAAGQWRHMAYFKRNEGWTMSKVEELGLVLCSDIIHKGGHGQQEGPMPVGFSGQVALRKEHCDMTPRNQNSGISEA